MIPFGVEEAVDLILALPAHRSGNEKHAEFGKMLVDEYFVGMRKHFEGDAQAYAYLNALFAAIGSAVRAFSVQHDIHQTRCDAEKAIKDSAVERAKRIAAYSLLDDFRGQFVTLFAGLSASGLAVYFKSNYWSLMIVPVLWVMLVVIDFGVKRYSDMQIGAAEAIFPQHKQETWQKENISKYEEILMTFIATGAEIQARYYPDSRIFGYRVTEIKASSLEIQARQLIEHHMAFL